MDPLNLPCAPTGRAAPSFPSRSSRPCASCREVKPPVGRGPLLPSQPCTSLCPQRTATRGHRSNTRVTEGNDHSSSGYHLPSAHSVLSTLHKLNDSHEQEPLGALGSSFHRQKGMEGGSEPACPKDYPPLTRGNRCQNTGVRGGMRNGRRFPVLRARNQEPCTLSATLSPDEPESSQNPDSSHLVSRDPLGPREQGQKLS